MLNILGKEYPSRLDELTVDQWERIGNIYAKEQDAETKQGATLCFVEIFRELGVPEKDLLELRRMPEAVFNDAVKKFDADTKQECEVVKEIELKGYRYACPLHNGDIFLTPEKRALINEKFSKRAKSGNFAYMMAVLFERTDLTPTEHYTKAHIEHKSELFKELKASVVAPVVFAFMKYNYDIMKAEKQALEDENSGELAGGND